MKTDRDNRKLVPWLAKNAMTWREVQHFPDVIEPGTFWVDDHGNVTIKGDTQPLRYWNPLTNPSDSMELLKRCAEKCRKEWQTLSIQRNCNCWEVFSRDHYDRNSVQADTLEQALAKFAFKLWGGKP